MSSFIYINATVRRADFGEISQKDFEDFHAFWKENFDPGQFNGELPCYSNDKSELWADYNNYSSFDGGEFVEFAESHPHLMIRVTVRSEDSPEGSCTDYLYHGKLYEELDEIRTMPLPRVVKWPRTCKPYDYLEKESEHFFHMFGGYVVDVLEDMLNNVSNEKLARRILDAADWMEGPANEMFEAITGKNFNEVIEQARAFAREEEEEDERFQEAVRTLRDSL